MYPTLFTIGGRSLSTFVVFLLIAIIFGVVVIWRIIRVYDFDRDKAYDLMLLTFFGGLISSRIYFVFFHQDQIDSLMKVFFINKYPGFAFWGAILGGILTLRLLCSRMRVNFWEIADFAIVALFLGIALTSLGCLFAGCQYGQVSNLLISVTQAGLIGKRFPLQIVESTVFFISFYYLWRSVLKFHFPGKIVSVGFIIFGVIKFFLEFFRGNVLFLPFGISEGNLYSTGFVIVGVWIYYRFSKRPFLSDLRKMFFVFVDSNLRQTALLKIKKNCYNLVVKWKLSVHFLHKKVLKYLNVKSNPTKF